MESSKTLYKSFIKLTIEFCLEEGMTLQQAKKNVNEEFEYHPYYEILSKYINRGKKSKKGLVHLLKKCLLICEEFGPNREYITLVTILKRLHKRTLKKNKKTSLVLKNFEKGISLINQDVPPPPLYNIFLESRLLLEWSSMIYLYPFIPKREKGNSKPVLLIPPYLANDISTSYMRKYLKSLGFVAYKWELGSNMIRSSYIPILEEMLDEIYDEHKEKVSIVGWSGGGIFAKILANRHPKKVAQIITIAAPIWGIMELKTSINGLFDFLRGNTLKERNRRFIKELEDIPDVPITCIYTKTDGVVPWKHCVEAETYRNDIKNIEVYGSHSGLGANVSVLLTVANSLSANLQGKKVQDITDKFESMFYPKFWKQKGNFKILNLFLKS